VPPPTLRQRHRADRPARRTQRGIDETKVAGRLGERGKHGRQFGVEENLSQEFVGSRDAGTGRESRRVDGAPRSI